MNQFSKKSYLLTPYRTIYAKLLYCYIVQEILKIYPKTTFSNPIDQRVEFKLLLIGKMFKSYFMHAPSRGRSVVIIYLFTLNLEETILK